ncbi:hypothetical protein FRB98_002224 [Tulasnella sp. 332]|nr:hypothetical protein FRB98_002224 [Tulasnella sp. 332]
MPLLFAIILAISASGVYGQQVQGCPSGWYEIQTPTLIDKKYCAYLHHGSLSLPRIPNDNGDCQYTSFSTGAWIGLVIGAVAVFITIGVFLKLLANRRARLIQEAVDVERADRHARCYPVQAPVPSDSDAVSVGFELPAYVPNPPAYGSNDLPSDAEWKEHFPSEPSVPPKAHHEEALHYSPRAFLSMAPMGYKTQVAQDMPGTDGR